MRWVSSPDHSRHVAAEDGERAGEDEARPAAGGAHRLEQLAGAVEIDPRAEVEVGLGVGADDGGQMPDQVGVGGEAARRWRHRRCRR